MEQLVTESNKQPLKVCEGVDYLCINYEYNYADHDCLKCRRLYNVVQSLKDTKYEVGISTKPLERTWE